MAKKSFGTNDPNFAMFNSMASAAAAPADQEKPTAERADVYQTLDRNADEANPAPGKRHTQGRKGEHAKRINIAFTDENYAYIRIMAAMTGQTLTDFVNVCIERHREGHEEAFQKALDIKNSL